MKDRMKKQYETYACEVVFCPAFAPMEAAVLPAGERARPSLLSMVPRAYDAPVRRENQRAKIWVR